MREQVGKSTRAGGSLQYSTAISLGFVSPEMHLTTMCREKPRSREWGIIYTQKAIQGKSSSDSSCGCQSPDPLGKGQLFKWECETNVILKANWAPATPYPDPSKPAQDHKLISLKVLSLGEANHGL